MTSPSVKLVLSNIDGLDDIAVRTILLKPNTTVHIGRCSKNPDKGLMAASDNALIDSPVISREHALFSTSVDMDLPNVCITDEKSRQGTFLNGSEVKRGTLQRLEMGDTLCFGQNVVRDTDSFKAQKYRVSYRLATPEPDRALPSGISVPEIITSDEEDADIEETFASSPYPPRYGSSSNPVNVDDFEDEAPPPAPAQQSVQFLLEEDDQDLDVYEPPPALVVEANPVVVVVPSTLSSALASNFDATSVDAESSDDAMDEDEDDEEEEEEEEDEEEEEEEEVDYPEEEDDGFDICSSDEHEYGSDGGASINESNEKDHDLPQSESYEELGNKSVDPYRHLNTKLETLINHDPLPKFSTLPTTYGPAIGLSELQPSPARQVFSSQYTQDAFNTAPTTSSGIDKPKEAQSPKQFSDPNTHAWDSIGASVHRPQAPKPCNWGIMDYAQPNLIRSQNPWSEEPYQSFLPTNMYSRPNITGYPATNFYEPKTAVEYAFGSDPLEFNHAQPSTPPTQSLDTRSDGASTQPATRTKVSIAEIVDDVLQQPLTPTSVDTSPSRKRKASVLEEDEHADSEGVEQVINKVEEHPLCSTTSVEKSTVEPPKKKARSTFSLVASAMAAGFVLGGTVVISALASIDITQ